MSEKQLTGAKKVFNTIITIVILVMLLSSLVFVWGDVLTIYIRNSYGSYSYNSSSVHVGLNYFIYDGWKNVANIASTYNNGLVTFGLYSSLLISLTAFIAAVIIVYVYGIRGMVDGLRALIARKTSHITKNAAIVSLTLFAYFIIAKTFSFHAYGPALLNGDIYITYIEGWGSTFYGFFGYFAMFLVIAYLIIEKFDTKLVANSVRNILIGLSTFFVLAIVSRAISDGFGYTTDSNLEGFGLFNLFIMLLGVPLTEEAFIFTLITTLLLVVTAVSAVVLLVSIVKHYFFGKEFNKKRSIIYIVLVGASSLLTMVIGNPTLEKLCDSIKATFSGNFSEASSLTSIFTCALVTLALFITAVCLNEKDEQKAEPEKIEDLN